MDGKPSCVIVTGRPGSGKSTLAARLGQQLRMPVLSRDAIKEGYLNSFGLAHDQMPPDINGIVSGIFFDILSQYLSRKISIVVEAAFQHAAWEARMPLIRELSRPHLIICAVSAELAAQRHLQRGLADPQREFYHGDKRVSVYRATGQALPPDEYVTPRLDVPTTHVSTQGQYSPGLDEIARRVGLAST